MPINKQFIAQPKMQVVIKKEPQSHNILCL